MTTKQQTPTPRPTPERPTLSTTEALRNLLTLIGDDADIQEVGGEPLEALITQGMAAMEADALSPSAGSGTAEPVAWAVVDKDKPEVPYSLLKKPMQHPDPGWTVRPLAFADARPAPSPGVTAEDR